MKNSIILVSLFVFLFTSCKKEQIVVEPQFGETPVFSIEGTIDGQNISMNAGVDDAFLTTYTTSVNGVNRYSGKMQKGDSYVDFGIFDGNIFANNSSILQAGNSLAFTQPFSQSLFTLNRSVCTNSALIDHLDIKLNNISVGESLTIYEPGIYTICVDVHFYDGSSKEVCNDIIVGYSDVAAFEIGYSISNQGLLFASTETDLTKTQTKWFIDGVLSSSTENCNYYLEPGLHILKAEVTFSNGATKSHSIIVDSDAQGRYFEEMNSFKTDLYPGLFQDFKAEFEVKIGSIVYSHIGSGANPQVSLTGISLYGKSAAGNDIYKVSGVINTQMKNTITQQVVNAQFSVVIGLEIP